MMFFEPQNLIQQNILNRDKGKGVAKKPKKKKEFSKRLIFWESFIVTGISAAGLYIAYVAVINSYTGALPWLTTMVTGAWGTYGVSQAFYYNKAKAENLIKISKSANGDAANRGI